VQSIVTTTPTRQTRELIDYLRNRRHGEKYLAAAAESTGAQALLLAGADVLPMGGFSGEVPFPDDDDLARLIAHGDLRYIVVDGPELRGGPDKPAALATDGWVEQHCRAIPPEEYGGGVTGTLYDCKGGA
jgi:hypothetical protein